MSEAIMLCACGVQWMPMPYGWRRMCRCKPTAPYWFDQAPLPADGVAFHQLTARRIVKRASMYLYGGRG